MNLSNQSMSRCFDSWQFRFPQQSLGHLPGSSEISTLEIHVGQQDIKEEQVGPLELLFVGQQKLMCVLELTRTDQGQRLAKRLFVVHWRRST